jgi:hypothetical protein
MHWKPDTCGCDWYLDENGAPVEPSMACGLHVADTLADSYAKCLDINQLKNKAVETVTAAIPDEYQETVKAKVNGTMVDVLTGDIAGGVQYDIGPDKVTISCPDVPTEVYANVDLSAINAEHDANAEVA